MKNPIQKLVLCLRKASCCMQANTALLSCLLKSGQHTISLGTVGHQDMMTTVHVVQAISPNPLGHFYQELSGILQNTTLCKYPDDILFILQENKDINLNLKKWWLGYTVLNAWKSWHNMQRILEDVLVGVNNNSVFLDDNVKHAVHVNE